MLKLPEHKNCINCGECCGPVPISDREDRAIKNYLKKIDKDKLLDLKQQLKDKTPLTCEFRDNKNKNCAIYPVRPVICKLFGVVKWMNCSNGNSGAINGMSFVDIKTSKLRSYLRNN